MDHTFALNYAGMSENELQRVARAYGDLTDEAQAALRAEFARRKMEAPLVEEDDGSRGRTLVTVRRYRDLSEAIVARSLLESAGIGVLLQDENLVRLDWQISNFIGGIRLQVDVQDEAEALEMLAQPVAETIELGEGQAWFPQPHCPVCGSVEITFEGASRGSALASLFLLAVPLPTGKKMWTCEHCGSRWEDEEG